MNGPEQLENGFNGYFVGKSYGKHSEEDSLKKWVNTGKFVESESVVTSRRRQRFSVDHNSVCLSSNKSDSGSVSSRSSSSSRASELDLKSILVKDEAGTGIEDDCTEVEQDQEVVSKFNDNGPLKCSDVCLTVVDTVRSLNVVETRASVDYVVGQINIENPSRSRGKNTGVSSVNGCHEAKWFGAIAELEDESRIFYVRIPVTEIARGSRRILLTLLETASDKLECNRVVLCLDREEFDDQSIHEAVRTFKFLGFQQVNCKQSVKIDSSHIENDLINLDDGCRLDDLKRKTEGDSTIPSPPANLSGPEWVYLTSEI